MARQIPLRRRHGGGPAAIPSRCIDLSTHNRDLRTPEYHCICINDRCMCITLFTVARPIWYLFPFIIIGCGSIVFVGILYDTCISAVNHDANIYSLELIVRIIRKKIDNKHRNVVLTVAAPPS